MPIVSMFFGIIIRMFYDDHGVPHFHAEYQGEQASFDLDGQLLSGRIGSKAALRRIARWAMGHRAELESNWGRLRQGLAPARIAGLTRGGADR